MLYLSETNARELIAHAREEYPNEACGILAGSSSEEVARVYRMANSDKSRVTFFMDPREQLKVMKEIRSLGLEMIGIYHSHPDTEAYPSARDVELAYYPEASYVVVSLKDKDTPSIRSFKITDGKIIEEEVKIAWR